ncbi:Sigma-70 region 2 [Sinorhizobium sp. NFACC03]|nr:Sigma-70 region 2 [Sinorhizobium sp. NFACC03]
MSGTRGTLELEHQLIDVWRSKANAQPTTSGTTTVVDLLPELAAWARRLSPSPEAATELTEQTLEYAIEHLDEFVNTSDVRGWLVNLMVELRLRRSRHLHSS